MRIFTAESNNEMAVQVYTALRKHGEESESRNGPVIRFAEPVCMRYTMPWVRGNFTPHRDANPFFHVAESMWMLAGRKDADFLCMFNKGMINYSDDGISFNAAYGYRLRHHFGYDQLEHIADRLKHDPDSRQAVANIWDPADNRKLTLDKACNLCLVFYINHDQLHMVVYNRSNDAVYGGVTGANPVHMSYFQQWVADQLKMPMGDLHMFSTNLHVYTELYRHWEYLQDPKLVEYPDAKYLPLGSLEEVENLCEWYEKGLPLEPMFHSPHLNDIVVPIMNAWMVRKYHNEDPMPHLEKCVCPNLKQACTNWIEARA